MSISLTLTYPTKKIQQVDVKLLTARIIKIMSSQNAILSGDIVLDILKSISNVGDEAGTISLLDSYKILAKSWIMTHGGDQYTKKIKCEECELVHFVIHDISNILETQADPIFSKAHTLKSAGVDHMVRLKPMSVLFLVESIKYAADQSNQDDILDAITWGMVDTIDGEKPDWDACDMNLLRQIQELLDPFTEELSGYMVKEGVCKDLVKKRGNEENVCEGKIVSSISIIDGQFLQGK